MPEAPPAEKPKIDPFVERLTKSLANAALDDNFSLKPLPPEDESGVKDSGLTVGEMMAAAKKPEPKPEDKVEAEKTEKPDEKPAEAPKEEVKAEDKPKEQEKPTEQPKDEVKVVPHPSDDIVSIQKKIQEEMAQINERISRSQSEIAERERKREEEAKANKPPEQPASNPDEDYDRTLPEEAQEVLDVLKWADSRPEHKGKAAEYRSYLRRLDEFSKTDPDEDALKRFELENKPKIGPRLIRTLREERIVETAEARAIEKARKENESKLEELRRKQHELEITPVVEKSVQNFKTRFTVAKKEDGKIDPEIAKEVMNGDSTVDEKYPIEAPIIKRHAQMFDEYLRLVNGLVDYTPESRPIQKLVVNFIAAHEEKMMGRPDSERIRNGKKFMPLSQLAQLKPEQQAHYWTYGPADIDQLLEQNTHLVVANEKKKIEKIAEKMGFSRKPAEAPDANLAEKQKETPAPAVPKASEEASPKATGSRSPGAAKTAQQPAPVNDFMKSLIPDIEKITGT